MCVQVQTWYAIVDVFLACLQLPTHIEMLQRETQEFNYFLLLVTEQAFYNIDWNKCTRIFLMSSPVITRTRSIREHLALT
jgi:hypothetical protein